MKKVMIYILIALLVLVSIIIIVVLSNPLRRTPERIRESMLELTPIGISIDEAMEVLEKARANENWKIVESNRQVGVDVSNLGFGRDEIERVVENMGLDSNMAGEKSIYVLFDRYRSGIIWTSVYAYWAFDENEELIEIFVRKIGSYSSPSHWENIRN